MYMTEDPQPNIDVYSHTSSQVQNQLRVKVWQQQIKLTTSFVKTYRFMPDGLNTQVNNLTLYPQGSGCAYTCWSYTCRINTVKSQHHTSEARGLCTNSENRFRGLTTQWILSQIYFVQSHDDREFGMCQQPAHFSPGTFKNFSLKQLSTPLQQLNITWFYLPCLHSHSADSSTTSSSGYPAQSCHNLVLTW